MKKQYTAEEKKAYFAEQRKSAEEALLKGVATCYTSENFRNYLRTCMKFHSYSINNCLLIASQMPGATQVAGYGDWQKKFKRQVRKGEKGIRILAPIPCKFDVDVPTADGGSEKQHIEFMRFKMVSVFDISQTDGEDLPKICKELTGTVADYDTMIEKLTAIAGIPVEFDEIRGGAHGYYSPKQQKIVIQTGMPQEQTVKTLIHEIAHSILHNPEAFHDIPGHIKEMQAESVAYIVCDAAGIDSSDYSFEYVASWAMEDTKALTEQMDIVRKTAESITERLMA